MTNEMLPFFPEPAPGEHIFSVLARYHYAYLSSKDFNRTTMDLLGGSKRINLKNVWRPDFDTLWSFYGGVIERQQLLEQHTPFYFDAKFLKLEQAESVISGSQTKILNFSGTKNIYNSLSWRWCAKCVEEDCDTYGFPFWHVEHQLPTMLTCTKHQHPLSDVCEHCGYYLTKLAKYHLPPKDNRCFRCKEVLCTDLPSLCEEQQWLDSFSNKLISSKKYGCRTNVAILLRSTLDCPNTEIELTKSDRERLHQAHLHLNNRVDYGPYSPYFSLPSAHGIRPKNPYSLNLIHLMYREGIYHPLCFLAALTAFCHKDNISKVLL